jgi:NAD(P)-dependent dehydrogenase (short-subunit alcohol dehydrogenase family)
MSTESQRLTGKVAVVTGASRGIGRAIAEALAKEGALVVLAARDRVALAEAGRACGENALTIEADVTDEASVERLFAEVAKHKGRIDLLVNNAGAFDGGPLDELSTEAWDKVLAVNLRAPFLCTRAALKMMKQQQSGRIINVGSIASKRARPHSAPYAASKHGLWGLTQVTAIEGREYGVTCCQLNPGNVRVERRESDKLEDQEPMMTPAEIAEAAVLMAVLPPHVEMLEATVLPHQQLYVGRG